MISEKLKNLAAAMRSYPENAFLHSVQLANLADQLAAMEREAVPAHLRVPHAMPLPEGVSYIGDARKQKQT